MLAYKLIKMNITKEGRDYSLVIARKSGYRDGKDCALLDRVKKNPYEYNSSEFHVYNEAWEDGYQDETKHLLK